MFFREAISLLSEESSIAIEGRLETVVFLQFNCPFKPGRSRELSAGERVTRLDAKYGVGFLHSDTFELIDRI